MEITKKTKTSFWMKLWQERYIYLLLLPMVLWLFVFHYIPTSGIILAFKKYKIGSLWSGDWIGLANFELDKADVLSYNINTM